MLGDVLYRPELMFPRHSEAWHKSKSGGFVSRYALKFRAGMLLTVHIVNLGTGYETLPCSQLITMVLQFRLEGPRPCTILCYYGHITAEYFNRNVSIGQFLQHISKSIVVRARSRPKMLTETYNKETCLAS